MLLPVGGAFIVSTLIVALMVNLLPWSGVWLQVKPDFVALVVSYWCIHQPRKVGFTVAFSLGLIMDVAEGSVFGQHALAYSVLAYAGLVLHRRVQNFTLKGQILHVLAILLLNDMIVLAVTHAGRRPLSRLRLLRRQLRRRGAVAGDRLPVQDAAAAEPRPRPWLS